MLAEYIAGARLSDLSPAIVEHTKSFVLDTLGVAIYGASMPWCERLRATAEAMEAPGRAAVWCASARFSAPMAAMVNATAVHAFELDNIGPGGHSGSVTLGSALALAPHVSQAGKSLTGAALIIALVVVSRPPPVSTTAWGACRMRGGVFMAPAYMAHLPRWRVRRTRWAYPPTRPVHALGHAGQQAASLMFTHHGGMGKRLLAGQAARAGTFAALLAQNGFTNAPNVFEAEYGGFCSAHTGNQCPPKYDLAEITRDLRSHYHTADVRFKMWATRIPNHGTLEAICAMRKQRDFKADDVKALRIRLGKGYLQNVAWAYKPTTITSAQLNLYFVSAIMLLENDVFTAQFTEEKVRDPRVLDLIQRIEITHDPALDGKGYVHGNPVEVELHDGTVLKAWGKARGDTDNPVHMSDIIEKFNKVTYRRLDAAKTANISALCERLDTLDDVSELIDLLL